MGRVIINGTFGQISEPMEVDFDPVRGMIIHQRIKSAGDNLAGWAGVLMNERIAFRWRRSPVVSTIDLTYSGGALGFADNAQTNWQLLANEQQFHIFESGIAKSGLQVFPSLIADIKNGFAFIQDGDSASALDFRDTLPDDELVYYDPLINFLILNQTHFSASQYALRRTYSISNFFDGDLPGEGNVEALVLMADILDYGMPPVIQTKLASIPIPESHPRFLWSWRQLPSTMTTGAQNRVEVSTEWWWAEWSTDLYQLA